MIRRTDPMIPSLYMLCRQKRQRLQFLASSAVYIYRILLQFAQHLIILLPPLIRHILCRHHLPQKPLPPMPLLSIATQGYYAKKQYNSCSHSVYSLITRMCYSPNSAEMPKREMSTSLLREVLHRYSAVRRSTCFLIAMSTPPPI